MTWPHLDIRLDGDGAFKDVAAEVIGGADLFRYAVLSGGMKSGLPSIALGLRLREGNGVVIAETSWRLINAAHVATAARYGVPT